MKKQLLIHLIIICTCTTAFSQIPNNGFENWANVPFQYQNPVSWNTNNSSPDGNNLVTSTTSAYQGTNAMKVLNFYNNIYQARCGGNANTKFYYTQRPLALTGYYKVDLQPGDTATIEVIFTNGNSVIGSGLQYITASSSTYNAFSVPINFINGSNPDSAFISISNGQPGLNFVPQVPDDSLLIDELVFDISSGIEDVSENTIKLHPNPASDFLNVEIPMDGWEGTVEIINSTGQMVLKDQIKGERSIKLNIYNFDTGLYLIKLIDANGTRLTQRFVKNNF